MSDTPQQAPKYAAGDPEVGRPPNNLPLQLSSFVGRGREISEVEALLPGHRLLILTGPGGSGKTCLALAVTSGVLQDYEESIGLAREAEDNFAIVISLIEGALGYSGSGDLVRAGTLCAEGLELAWKLKMMPRVSGHLNVSAVLAGLRGSQPKRRGCGALLSHCVNP